MATNFREMEKCILNYLRASPQYFGTEISWSISPALQLENIPWWSRQKYFKGKQMHFGGTKCTKYNKINNNSENFKEARLLPGKLLPPAPPNCGATFSPKFCPFDRKI